MPSAAEIDLALIFGQRSAPGQGRRIEIGAALDVVAASAAAIGGRVRERAQRALGRAQHRNALLAKRREEFGRNREIVAQQRQ